VDDVMLPRLTVVTSVNGLGDMGYYDKIMEGVMNFYEQHDLEMNLICPQDEEEVKQIISNWQNETRNEHKSLLLLADSEYEKLLRQTDIILSENQKILLFESRSTDLPDRVYTFYINRYGVSYLAGCMAREHTSATIIAAMSDNPLLEESINGFSDGYNSGGNNSSVNVVYLSKDETGFSMPNKAFQLAGDIENSFIYPLAGGSNSGIYKYSRETPLYLPLIAGMDTDCSLLSSRIPFSVVINIDRLVEQYLSEWYNGLEYAKNEVYGLEDSVTDIVISPVFYERMDIWEDYYSDPNYWNSAYANNIEEAKEKEGRYE
ncbi:MAG: BMP family ABC transporter substrate-binding protein, partial [Parabacteroides sp.]|nr:BMP family ABC transporter substrate-binding protein [Parabacteroides sp.]